MLRKSLAATLLIIHVIAGNASATESDPCTGSASDLNRNVDELQVYIAAYLACVNVQPSADQCVQQMFSLRDAQQRTLKAQYAFNAACGIKR